MEDVRIKYFAYGSNMNARRMGSRGVGVYSMKSAELKGFELVFNKLSSSYQGEGFANIQRNQGSNVEGILYEINPEGITSLDYYENYPVGYDRTLIKVSNAVQDGVLAYAYIAQPGRVAPNLKPRRNYINHLLCAEGYLSAEYIARLNNVLTLD